MRRPVRSPSPFPSLFPAGPRPHAGGGYRVFDESLPRPGPARSRARPDPSARPSPSRRGFAVLGGTGREKRPDWRGEHGRAFRPAAGLAVAAFGTVFFRAPSVGTVCGEFPRTRVPRGELKVVEKNKILYETLVREPSFVEKKRPFSKIPFYRSRVERRFYDNIVYVCVFVCLRVYAMSTYR